MSLCVSQQHHTCLTGDHIVPRQSNHPSVSEKIGQELHQRQPSTTTLFRPAPQDARSARNAPDAVTVLCCRCPCRAAGRLPWPAGGALRHDCKVLSLTLRFVRPAATACEYGDSVRNNARTMHDCTLGGMDQLDGDFGEGRFGFFNSRRLIMAF